MADLASTIQNLQKFTNGKKYNTIYADPPWQFQNRTGKVAPEHKRLTRYETMTIEDIKALPIADITGDKAHLYLWVPNALLPDGLAVMDAWGFEYKGNLVWEKVRKDGGPDGRGVGFYFRNVTELILFGIKKKSAPNRTLQPARSQVNIIRAMKREHSRKPDEIIPIIEACSQGLELNCLQEESEKAGICGEIKPQKIMNQLGIHMLIIQLLLQNDFEKEVYI